MSSPIDPAIDPDCEPRSWERLSAHYDIEKKLANRLRVSSREERGHLYASLYAELYRRVPDHPQLRQKSAAEMARKIRWQVNFLRRFIGPGTLFLEVGPGRCELALEVACRVKRVYAVDVTEVVVPPLPYPDNFLVFLSDGSHIPLRRESIHVAYSHQLMEHLHPDDAIHQMENIYQTLTPGGRYICITPNRLSGPHDISKYFDPVATGFHLKEYTTSELTPLLRQAGFSKVMLYVRVKGRFVRIPFFLIWCCEQFLSLLPDRFQKALARQFPLKHLLDILLVGVK